MKYSHRIASQPLLSDVNKEKGEDELGEKNSVLAQACIYCATCSAQVQHAESGPVKGERTHSAFKECKNTRVALLGFTRQLEKYEVRNDSSKRGMFGKSGDTRALSVIHVLNRGVLETRFRVFLTCVRCFYCVLGCFYGVLGVLSAF